MAYRTAGQSFIMPLLRADTGATITIPEELKEMNGGVPKLGASPEEYKATMDRTLFRVAEEFGKHPETGYYSQINRLVMRGEAQWFPTDKGMAVRFRGVDYFPNDLYNRLQSGEL